MADDPTPMTDADVEAPPSTTRFQPAEPLKDTGVRFDAAGSTPEETGRAGDAKTAIRDNAGKLGQQAVDRLRLTADDGKARAGGALDQLSQMLTEAAGQVDEKLGAQYGQYARNAAGQVQGLADTVRNKDVDELLDDARGFVRASPAVAIGVAAAVGFAVARLFQAGLDEPHA